MTKQPPNKTLSKTKQTQVDLEFLYEPDFPYKGVYGTKTNNRKTIGINLSILHQRSSFSKIISHEHIHAIIDKLENDKTCTAFDNLFEEHPFSKLLETLK